MYNNQIKVKVSDIKQRQYVLCVQRNILRALSETEIIKIFKSTSEQDK